MTYPYGQKGRYGAGIRYSYSQPHVTGLANSTLRNTWLFSFAFQCHTMHRIAQSINSQLKIATAWTHIFKHYIYT